MQGFKLIISLPSGSFHNHKIRDLILIFASRMLFLFYAFLLVPSICCLWKTCFSICSYVFLWIFPFSFCISVHNLLHYSQLPIYFLFSVCMPMFSLLLSFSFTDVYSSNVSLHHPLSLTFSFCVCVCPSFYYSTFSFYISLAISPSMKLLLKMGKTWPLCVYFRSFHMTNIAQIL